MRLLGLTAAVSGKYAAIQTISETIDKIREQKGGFIDLILGTLAASLLGTIFADKEVILADEGTIRATQDF